MKKILPYFSLLLLLTAACVSKKQFYATQVAYQDSLSRVRKDFKQERERLLKAEKVILLFRQRSQEYQQQIQIYEDSLRALQQILQPLMAQEGVSENLLQKIQTLHEINEDVVSQLNQAKSEHQTLNEQNLRMKEYAQTLADSLKTLQMLVSEAHYHPSNRSQKLNLFDNTFDCYLVDLRDSQIRFFWKNARGQKYRSLKNLYRQLLRQNQQLLFATNAGMFTAQNIPQGLYVENGRELRPLDLKKEGWGNFYMKPNGVFAINPQGKAQVLRTEQFLAQGDSTIYATQSGPMLVIDGKIHHYFTPGSSNKYIRSGVGVIDEHRIVFVISRKPVNFYDFASIFKDQFQCKNALYLDGAISRMFLPDLGRFDLDGDFGPMIGIVK